MSNDNMTPEIKELAVRTSAAFILFDMLARVLDKRGILSRSDLAADIVAIVDQRKADLAKMAAQGFDLAAFKEALVAIEKFAKSDLRS